jgi:glycine betaine transporter
MTGVAFGVATSLGLGSLQIHAGLHSLFEYPLGIKFTIGLIAGTTFLYLTSALTGLDRGIRILSNTNLILAIILLFSVFFLGPTNFLVEIFFSSLGSYLQNFITMSFRMAPFSDSTWLTKWTFFYWAWWISWAPFVATFIARISKGRTIREYLLGVMIVPSLLSAFWFSVLGGTAIYLERFKGIQIINNTNEEITSVLFETLRHLPFGEILSFFSIILILIFFVTSADSATFVLGMFSSEGDPDPNVKTKIIWGSFVSILASALLYLGGLEALQTIAIIISFPFTLLLFFFNLVFL